MALHGAVQSGVQNGYYVFHVMQTHMPLLKHKIQGLKVKYMKDPTNCALVELQQPSFQHIHHHCDQQHLIQALKFSCANFILVFIGPDVAGKEWEHMTATNYQME